MTPRKTRPRNHASSNPQQSLVSDYDSDAPYTIPTQLRTIEEINHTVIKRYVPELSSILQVGPSAYVYTYSPETETWDKTSIEGSMFVCELSPSPTTSSPRHCFVILNRKGMENLIVYSNEILAVEITEYLIIQFRTHGQIKTLGLFMTTNNPEDKQRICELVKSHWEMAMEEKEALEGEEGMAENWEEGHGGGEPARDGIGENQPMGRRISLSELFGMR